MCLIIINKPNKRTSSEYLRAAAETNKDGIGVAFNVKKNLTVKKDFFNVDEFIEYYNGIPPESTIVTHFRLASVGDKSLDNIHPFNIDEKGNVVLFHNGTMDAYKPSAQDKSSGISDTVNFNNTVMRPLYDMNRHFYKKPFIHKIIEDHVRSSKLVIFNSAGEFYVINEKLGTWEDESWYSNTIFKNKIPKPNTTPNNSQYSTVSNVSIKIKIKRNKTNVMSGGFIAPDKPLYLIGDKTYRQLEKQEILNLMLQHNCGYKKLVKKCLIGKLDNVPRSFLADAEKCRLDEYLKKHSILSDRIDSPTVLKSNTEIKDLKYLALPAPISKSKKKDNEISDEELDLIGKLNELENFN